LGAARRGSRRSFLFRRALRSFYEAEPGAVAFFVQISYHFLHGEGEMGRQFDNDAVLRLQAAELLYPPEQEAGGTEDRAQKVLQLVPQANDPQGSENYREIKYFQSKMRPASAGCIFLQVTLK
jgi:hypothetical protein